MYGICFGLLTNHNKQDMKNDAKFKYFLSMKQIANRN